MEFATAPPTGQRIFLTRRTPIVQNTDYSSQGAVSPEQVERDLDYRTLVEQENNGVSGRALTFPIGSSGRTIAEIPAGSYYVTDEEGNLVEGGNNATITGAQAAGNQVAEDAVEVAQNLARVQELLAQPEASVFQTYPTIFAFNSATVPSSETFVRLQGYTTQFDSSAFFLRRVATEPTHLMKHQDASGAWFEYLYFGQDVDIEHGGAIGVLTGTIVGDAGAAYNRITTIFPKSGGCVIAQSLTYGQQTTMNFGDGSATQISTKSGFQLKGRNPIGAYNSIALGDPTEIGAVTEVREEWIGGTVFHWIGPANGVPILVRGPVTYRMENFIIDGNYSCAEGIFETHSLHSYMFNVTIWACTRCHRLDAWVDQTLVFKGANNNTYERCTFSNNGLIGTGSDLGVVDFDGGILGVSQNYFKHCEWVCADDAGAACIVLRGIDACRFQDCYTFSPGEERGQGVFIIPPTPTTNFPNANVFPTEITFTGGGMDNGISTPPANWNVELTGNRGLLLEGVFEGDMFDPTRFPRGWPSHPAIYGYTKSGTWIGRQIQRKHLLTDDTTEDLAFENLTFGRLNYDRAATSLDVSADTSLTTVQQLWNFTMPSEMLRSYWVRDLNTLGGSRKDRVLVFEAFGVISNVSGVGVPVNFALTAGGQVAGATGFQSIPAGTNFRQWHFKCIMQQSGQANAFRSVAFFSLAGNAANTLMAPKTLDLKGGNTGFFIDSDIANAFLFQIQYQTTGAANTQVLQLQNAELTLK